MDGGQRRTRRRRRPDGSIGVGGQKGVEAQCSQCVGAKGRRETQRATKDRSGSGQLMMVTMISMDFDATIINRQTRTFLDVLSSATTRIL